MTPTPPDKDEIDEILTSLQAKVLTESREPYRTNQRFHAKQAINRLIAEARIDLLERVRSEVIGSDDVWNGALKAMQTRVVVRNSLRNEQRSALQKIKDEINGNK